MNDIALVIGAMRFVIWLSIPFLVATVIGALLAGALRVVTQIEDASLNFAAKFSATVVLLYLFGASYSNKLVSYAQSLWGRADFYH